MNSSSFGTIISLKATYRAICSAIDTPSREDLLNFSAIYDAWLAVPVRLEKHLFAKSLRRSTRSTQKDGRLKQATDALEWIYSKEVVDCASLGYRDEWDYPESWRDVLAAGVKSYSEFVDEIRNPCMSYPSWDCLLGCEEDPEQEDLLCSQRRCASCCSDRTCDHDLSNARDGDKSDPDDESYAE